MTPNQRRRLEALAMPTSTCIGRRREDIKEAESVITWQSLHLRLAEFLTEGEPPPRPPDDELERERAEANAAADRARVDIAKVLKTVPPRKRKLSCLECEPKKRRRDQAEALARQVSANIEAIGPVLADPRTEAKSNGENAGAASKTGQMRSHPSFHIAPTALPDA